MSPTFPPRRTRAVIYIPPTMSLDGHYASHCMTYALDRGYQPVATVRDWSDIDRMLCTGWANVVVVAREEHWVGEGGELCGDEPTVADLGRYRDVATTRPIQLNPCPADRLRRVLDGEEPAPDGVAPETVAALRLIWWRLNDS